MRKYYPQKVKKSNTALGDFPTFSVEYDPVPDFDIHLLANDDQYDLASKYNILNNDNIESIITKKIELNQNYPNPFNPITLINYELTYDGLVNITIYDMMGRIVKTLVDNSQTAGYKSVQWNATNNRNKPVSAGLYLYTIQVGETRQTKKMVLLK